MMLTLTAALLLTAADLHWTRQNAADAAIAPSYCYGDDAENCKRYGRLYTWDSAVRACQALGAGWRLPTHEDWLQLAQRYGGIHRQEDAESGKSAYRALLGNSLRILLGGGRNPDGTYKRIDAHGFYWTSTETSAGNAWFINFGKGAKFMNHHPDGEKVRAFSVRCVRD